MDLPILCQHPLSWSPTCVPQTEAPAPPACCLLSSRDTRPLVLGWPPSNAYSWAPHPAPSTSPNPVALPLPFHPPCCPHPSLCKAVSTEKVRSPLLTYTGFSAGAGSWCRNTKEQQGADAGQLYSPGEKARLSWRKSGDSQGHAYTGAPLALPSQSMYGLPSAKWAQVMQTRDSPALRQDQYLRVSRGGDEIEAAVDSSVRDAFLPGNVHLLLQELLILFVDVLLNGFPAAGGRKQMGVQRHRTWELIPGRAR